jgi:hypothetical protein
MKGAFETGRRAQEAWFKALGGMSQRPGDADRFFGHGERFFRELTPFVGKNMEALAHTCDTTLRSSLDAFRVACDAALTPAEGDAYDASRQVWDAAFGAARASFDAFGKAGAKTMENCSVFCDALLREEGNHRATGTTSKSSKANA